MSYENIVAIISPELGKAISELLKNPKQASNNLADLVRFQKSKKGRAMILSKLFTTFANVILTQIPNPFVNITIENIRKNSEGKNPNVKFDLNFELDPPIKPFVEYEIVVNDVPTSKQKVTFQLNTSVSMNDLEIRYEGEQKIVWLGKSTTITIEPTIQNFEIMGIKSNMPLSFGSKGFTVDLSTCKITLE
jgi:hypothetical protein